MSLLFRWLFFGSLQRIAIAMLALLSIFTIIELFDKARYLGQELDTSTLIEYLGYKSLMMIEKFMPVIMLIGIAIHINELSRHQELLAMRAAGLGLSPLLKPLFAVAFLAASFSFLLGDQITPITNQRLDVIEDQVIHHKTAHKHQDVQWIHEGQRIYRLHSLLPGHFQIRLFETDAQGHWLRLIEAENGFYANTQWQLHKVHISTPDTEGNLHVENKDHETIFSLISPDAAQPPSPSHMSWSVLHHYAETLQSAGLNADAYIYAWHRKMAAPLGVVIMAILALSLCMSHSQRSGFASWGLAAAMIIGMMFYVLDNASSLLAGGGRLPAAFAAWLPNCIFAGFAGFWLLHREEQ